MTSLYRRIYKAITLMAAPAMLWTAYEMYVLTLNGQQMLFFLHNPRISNFRHLCSLLSAAFFNLVWSDCIDNHPHAFSRRSWSLAFTSIGLGCVSGVPHFEFNFL